MTMAFLQNRTSNARKSFVLTVSFLALGAVVYLLAILPTVEDLSKEQRTLDKLQGELRLKKAGIKGAADAEKRLVELKKELKPLQEAQLEKTLDSYAERAKQILDPLALGAGLTDVFYHEEGLAPRALPVPKGPLPKQLYARQAIRVTASGSYQAAISFILRLEKEMPLVSLQSLNIAVQNASNTEQAIEIVLEWPVKGKVTRP